MPRSVIIPITNVYAKGDFTAKIKIGSQGATANLILDTGSSSLVVQGEDYMPADDEVLEATSLAQNKTYGMGGWFGPVVKTRIAMGDGPFSVDVQNVNIAVTKKEQEGNFVGADGIIGLAYHELNKAYDLTEYLDQHQVEPATTYPWFLAEDQQDDSVRQFRSFLKEYPSSYIQPYFCQLEEEGVVGNQFALLIHRSSIYQTSRERTLKQLKRHPLNNGFFVMGHPKFHKHLYKGHFKTVKVMDDKYYNVRVKSMQVGDCAAREAPELEERHKNYRTNGIVDTGASAIILPKSLFDQMITDLVSINPEFDAILEPYKTFEGVEEGVNLELLDLNQWPSIYFILEGLEGEDVRLELKADNYWQIHAPQPNQASFQFVFLERWPNQCIFGIPLMTNYFTIFDRQEQENGILLFAEKP
ncbi:pepsin-like aspartic protease [Marinicella sp. W31]|uniref:pepsin-like aspartic protease n=1 Tax=Marinicella sp. W31 TaxID=3023713 RepID=UPI0037576992